MPLQISLYALALLMFADVGVGTSDTVQVSIPEAPPAGTQVLDASKFQGYSIETGDFAEYAGNLSTPNKLTIQSLRNLQRLGGSPVPIRVGGTTANSATWVPTQAQAVVPHYETPGADQPANLTLGPVFLESFHALARGTEYTVCLSFNDGAAGERETVESASFFYESLGRSLRAFEVGNEFDVFPTDRNTSTWTVQTYVSQWLSRTTAISNHLTHLHNQTRPTTPLYQGAVFLSPGLADSSATWTVNAVLDLGLASTHALKDLSIHQYFGAACTAQKPTMASSILNRTLLAQQMAYHASSSAYAVSKGIPYVLGETNSIACQGLAGVSDAFGAALWSVDYAMWAASLNVSRLDWHMGVGYRYSAWQAVRNGTTEPGPRPLYYGNWFVAAALGSGRKQLVPVVNTTTLAGYAVYGVRRRAVRLEKIVLVNVHLFNSTDPAAGERSSVEFQLSEALLVTGTASLRRLTAAGAEVKEGVTFAGQSVDLGGNIVGKESVEPVENGKVTVKASEAVLISFEDGEGC